MAGEGPLAPCAGLDGDFDTLSVTGLSTGDPEEAAEIRATGVINEFSRLELEGRITPLKRPPEVDLRLAVSRLDLSPYSPYVVGRTGVVVNQGVLDLQSRANVSKGAIDGQVKVDVRHLDVQTMSEQEAQQVADAIGVPVETALGLLKDAEGRIELTIPIGGTIDEPEADVSEAVNRAVVGVLRAIFPPNIIARMFSGASDDVAFEPVIFAPGSTELDAAATEYLDRLAGLMGEHPDVVISLCGRSVGSETSAIAAMLAARLKSDADAPQSADQIPAWVVESWAGNLAVDRARAAKRHLVGLGVPHS